MEPQGAPARHDHQGVINCKITRPDPESIAKIAETYSAFVLDRMGKYGACSPRIKPLSSGMRLCGPAVTQLGADLSVRRMAIDLAQEGDVLVVAAGGLDDYSCFGDGTALRMSRKNMAGAVIDGCVRDSGFLREMNFPTFCRGVTPRNYHYPLAAEYGGVNVPVSVGGVTVHPGDLIFGDDDGVVVVPLDMVDRIAKIVSADILDERELRAGMTSFVPFGVEDELRARGYTFNTQEA